VCGRRCYRCCCRCIAGAVAHYCFGLVFVAAGKFTAAEAQVEKMMLLATGFDAETASQRLSSCRFMEMLMGVRSHHDDEIRRHGVNAMLIGLITQTPAVDVDDIDVERVKHMAVDFVDKVYDDTIDDKVKDCISKQDFAKEMVAIVDGHNTQRATMRARMQEQCRTGIKMLQNIEVPTHNDNDAEYLAKINDAQLVKSVVQAQTVLDGLKHSCDSLHVIPAQFLGECYSQGTSLVHFGMTALCTSTLIKLLASQKAQRGVMGTLEKVSEALQMSRDDSLSIPGTIQGRATELLQKHAPSLLVADSSEKKVLTTGK
jgi:hypothetical protein